MSTSPPCILTNWFVDLELTGLNTPDRDGPDAPVDEIVEFGVIGTDADFQPIFRQTIVVMPTAHGLARIDSNPIVRDMHVSNGLLDELTLGYLGGGLPDISEAERMLIEMIDVYSDSDNLILSGSGIWHCDIRFLRLHTPNLFKRFAEREIVDAGIDRRGYFRATGTDLTEANSGKNHRADYDIQCSLEEAQAHLAMKREHASRLATVTA